MESTKYNHVDNVMLNLNLKELKHINSSACISVVLLVFFDLQNQPLAYPVIEGFET